MRCNIYTPFILDSLVVFCPCLSFARLLFHICALITPPPPYLIKQALQSYSNFSTSLVIWRSSIFWAKYALSIKKLIDFLSFVEFVKEIVIRISAERKSTAATQNKPNELNQNTNSLMAYSISYEFYIFACNKSIAFEMVWYRLSTVKSHFLEEIFCI